MSDVAPNGRGGADTPTDPDAEAWVVEVSGSSRGKFIRARLPITSFGAPDIELLEDGTRSNYRDPFERHIAGDPEAGAQTQRIPRPLPAVREPEKEKRTGWLPLAAAALVGAAVIGGVFLVSQLNNNDDGDTAANAGASTDAPLVSGEPVGLASFAELGESCRVKFDRAVFGPPPITRLQNLGISVLPLRPAISTAQAQYAFPVRASDNVICGQLGGTIGLRGGVAFTNGQNTLEMRRLRIDGGTGLVRTFASGALAGTDRVALDLDKGRWVQESEFVTYRVPVELTDRGATDLNATMGLEDFAEGDAIGILSLTGQARIVLEEETEDAPEGG